MKLFDTEHYEDYGHEWYFQVLPSRKFALLDITVQWDEFPVTDIFPLLIISIGNIQLFGFTFRWNRFEISVDVIDTKPRNLEWYRREKK